MSAIAASVELRRDVRVIGWVGGAHGASHFYQLALPPLFPFIHAQQDVSYTQLGFLIAVFYFFSGVFQPFAGFLVDHIGPRRVLYTGIGSMAVATALYGVAPNYWALLLLVSLSGLGNAVFHPADYTILSHRVAEQRVGRAFSFHALVGFAGYAAAPLIMIGLASQFGWRAAAIIVGIAGVGFLAMLRGNGHELLEVIKAEPGQSAPVSIGGQLQVLKRLVVIACFLLFCLSAMGQIGLQTFTASALFTLFQTPLTVGNAAVTSFLLATCVGIVCGGMIADRTTRHQGLAMVCLAFPAVAGVIPGFVALSSGGLWFVLAIMGLGFGMQIPLRDMLVRAIAPRHSSGKVFGFVYSGLDVGGMITPVLFGWLVDRHLVPWMFACIGACFALAIVVAMFARPPAAE